MSEASGQTALSSPAKPEILFLLIGAFVAGVAVGVVIYVAVAGKKA